MISMDQQHPSFNVGMELLATIPADGCKLVDLESDFGCGRQDIIRALRLIAQEQRLELCYNGDGVKRTVAVEPWRVAHRAASQYWDSVYGKEADVPEHLQNG